MRQTLASLPSPLNLAMASGPPATRSISPPKLAQATISPPFSSISKTTPYMTQSQESLSEGRLRSSWEQTFLTWSQLVSLTRKESWRLTGQIWTLTSSSSCRRFCLSEQEDMWTRETLRKGVLLSGSICSTRNRSSNSSLSMLNSQILSISHFIVITCFPPRCSTLPPSNPPNCRPTPLTTPSSLRPNSPTRLPASTRASPSKSTSSWKTVPDSTWRPSRRTTRSRERTQSLHSGRPWTSRKDRTKRQRRLRISKQLQSGLVHHKQSKPLNSRSFNKIMLSFDEQARNKRGRQRSKRTVTQASAKHNHMTKTSMGGFYYVQNTKRERMLEKVRAQRQRLHSLKLNEAMLVSKYASKFQINMKDMVT